jgi:hypothetical protein
LLSPIAIRVAYTKSLVCIRISGRAVRWVRKNQVFTAAVVFVLALGIGANSAVFSIVDPVLLRPSSFPQPEHLMRVEERTTGGTWTGVPVKDYQRWAGRTDIFEGTAAFLRDAVTLTGDGEPEQVIGHSCCTTSVGSSCGFGRISSGAMNTGP